MEIEVLLLCFDFKEIVIYIYNGVLKIKYKLHCFVLYYSEFANKEYSSSTTICYYRAVDAIQTSIRPIFNWLTCVFIQCKNCGLIINFSNSNEKLFCTGNFYLLRLLKL